jgi:hypothetical protein
MSRSSKCSISIRFPHQSPACTCRVHHSTTSTTHLILLVFTTRIAQGNSKASMHGISSLYL